MKIRNYSIAFILSATLIFGSERSVFAMEEGAIEASGLFDPRKSSLAPLVTGYESDPEEGGLEGNGPEGVKKKASDGSCASSLDLLGGAGMTVGNNAGVERSDFQLPDLEGPAGAEEEAAKKEGSHASKAEAAASAGDSSEHEDSNIEPVPAVVADPVETISLQSALDKVLALSQDSKITAKDVDALVEMLVLTLHEQVGSSLPVIKQWQSAKLRQYAGYFKITNIMERESLSIRNNSGFKSHRVSAKIKHAKALAQLIQEILNPTLAPVEEATTTALETNFSASRRPIVLNAASAHVTIAPEVLAYDRSEEASEQDDESEDGYDDSALVLRNFEGMPESFNDVITGLQALIKQQQTHNSQPRRSARLNQATGAPAEVSVDEIKSLVEGLLAFLDTYFAEKQVVLSLEQEYALSKYAARFGFSDILGCEAKKNRVVDQKNVAIMLQHASTFAQLIEAIIKANPIIESTVVGEQLGAVQNVVSQQATKKGLLAYVRDFRVGLAVLGVGVGVVGAYYGCPELAQTSINQLCAILPCPAESIRALIYQSMG